MLQFRRFEMSLKKMQFLKQFPCRRVFCFRYVQRKSFLPWIADFWHKNFEHIWMPIVNQLKSTLRLQNHKLFFFQSNKPPQLFLKKIDKLKIIYVFHRVKNQFLRQYGCSASWMWWNHNLWSQNYTNRRKNDKHGWNPDRTGSFCAIRRNYVQGKNHREKIRIMNPDIDCQAYRSAKQHISICDWAYSLSHFIYSSENKWT